MKKVLCIAVLVFSIHHGFSQERTNNKFGKGIQAVAQDSSFYMKFGMRFQTLYDGSLNLTSNEWSDKFMIRRARLKFEGFAYSPKLTYKMELGLSNRDNGKVANESNNAANIILDAFLKYNFAPGWEVWLGQTKLPSNRERIISSQKLQFVERSALNSNFTVDRGIGLQLKHSMNIGDGVIREQAAISMGEGRNITANNVGGYEYTGHLEYLPLGEFASKGEYFGSDLKRESSPKLAIGVTYDFNDNATREQGFKGDYMAVEQDMTTLLVDAMFKYQGISTMLEYANKQTSGNPVGVDINGNTGVFVTGTAINAQAGYLFNNNFEVAGRYTLVQPENENWDDDHTIMTLGISRYVVGHSLKIQSDVSHINYETKDDKLQVRFQVELSF